MSYTSISLRLYNLHDVIYYVIVYRSFYYSFVIYIVITYSFTTYTLFLYNFVTYKMQPLQNETSILLTIRRVRSSKDEGPAILISAHQLS